MTGFQYKKYSSENYVVPWKQNIVCNCWRLLKRTYITWRYMNLKAILYIWWTLNFPVQLKQFSLAFSFGAGGILPYLSIWPNGKLLSIPQKEEAIAIRMWVGKTSRSIDRCFSWNVQELEAYRLLGKVKGNGNQILNWQGMENLAVS